MTIALSYKNQVEYLCMNVCIYPFWCTCGYVCFFCAHGCKSICTHTTNTHNPTAATPSRKNLLFEHTRGGRNTAKWLEALRQKGAATPHSTQSTSLTPRHFGEEAGRFVADGAVCGRPLRAAHFTCGFFLVQHLEDGGLAQVGGNGGEEDGDRVRSESREERGRSLKQLRNKNDF